jgi:hypothetical protein
MGTIETEIITADTWQQAVYQHSHSGCYPSIEHCRQYWPDRPDDEAFKNASPVHVAWVEIDHRCKAINRLQDVSRVLRNQPKPMLGEVDFHRVADWVDEAINLL